MWMCWRGTHRYDHARVLAYNRSDCKLFMNEFFFFCECETEREWARAGSQIELITVRTICAACIFIIQFVSYTHEQIEIIRKKTTTAIAAATAPAPAVTAIAAPNKWIERDGKRMKLHENTHPCIESRTMSQKSVESSSKYTKITKTTTTQRSADEWTIVVYWTDLHIQNVLKQRHSYFD